MHLKTILNRRHRLKCFVYSKVEIVERFEGDAGQLHVEVNARKNSRPRCDQCRKAGPIYDTRGQRRFEFIPILGMQVFLLYTMRRVDCPDCGVKTEHLDWADGKEQMTVAYKWFLSTWARRMNWSEVARVFGTSWNRVYRSVQHAVTWGLQHRQTPQFKAIGDETAYQRGEGTSTSRSCIRSTPVCVGYCGLGKTGKKKLSSFSSTRSKTR